MKSYKQLLKELPSKTAVFAFGSFNPPNVGHELEIKIVRKLAKQNKSDHIVFVSAAQDSKKNPLDIGKKLQYLELFFPNTKFIPLREEYKTCLDVVKSLNGKYKNLIFVVSSPKVEEYKKILQQYNGKHYRFDTIEVVPAGNKDPDADDKLRNLASKGNFLTFKSNLPTTARDLDCKRLMNDIRISMGLEPIKEQINLVKDDLREQYFRGEIFNEGDIVESDNTVYKIIKRGSNHLLLQCESGEKVSKWIQDVQLTERTFMLNEDIQQSGTGKIGQDTSAKTAENQRKVLELKAKQAKQIEDVKERQTREMQMARDSMKESAKYNIPKSIMSLQDFRKTMHMGVDGVDQTAMDDKQTESDLDAAEHATTSPQHTITGGQHMDAGGNESLRRMRVKYHLGEETEEQKSTREEQLKRFQAQAKDSKLTDCKEEVEQEDFQINEIEFEAQIQEDLNILSEDDYLEAYDDEELAVIDEETGEELELSEGVELDSPALMEVLSRVERIKAKARMSRSKAKRDRRHQVAIRQLSSPQVANKRARRLAVAAVKKRLLQGRNPYKVSVGEKERVERFVQQRKKIIDRLSARMVSRVKQIEKSRLSHKKFTKPNNGVSF